MSDKPILFSGPMVRALLAGIKTQTRRAIRPRGPANLFDGTWSDSYVLDPGNQSWRDRNIRIRVGDRLYVREAWRVPAQDDRIAPRDLDRQIVGYEADCQPGQISATGRFRQAMHMPRWASRLTLTVTDVRVERLQDISEADAIAEGVEDAGNGAAFAQLRDALRYGTPRDCYASLWNSINGPGSWDANPWVAAYTFTVERGNIDQIGKAA